MRHFIEHMEAMTECCFKKLPVIRLSISCRLAPSSFGMASNKGINGLNCDPLLTAYGNGGKKKILISWNTHTHLSWPKLREYQLCILSNTWCASSVSSKKISDSLTNSVSWIQETTPNNHELYPIHYHKFFQENPNIQIYMDSNQNKMKKKITCWPWMLLLTSFYFN